MPRLLARLTTSTGSPLRPATTRTRLAGVAVTVASLALSGTVGLLAGSPAYAAGNPVTPGAFTGLGFDQCNAPSQSAMTAWRKASPFRAVGIYISGNSRACRAQPNLTPTWVGTQLAAGWHLLPITLGPQVSCSARFPRYGRTVDPTIDATSTGGYANARAQGAAEATKAVSAASGLGIVRGSTLFYDLEGWSSTSTSACTRSALQFLSGWTTSLHRSGYASGVYSSGSSGIRFLDDARVTPGSGVVQPDQLWTAEWNGTASVRSAYLRSDGWMPSRRLHQFRGGHDETWGGVRINIDSNYLQLSTPTIPGAPAPTPTPTPTPTPSPVQSTPTAPASGPAYTGSSMSDPRCSPSTINRTAYAATGTAGGPTTVPLQCLLKQQHLYPYAVTGTWNAQTTTAIKAWQKRVGHRQQARATARDLVSLFTAGTSRSVLRRGVHSADVTRVQRALNAAGTPHLTVTGTYNRATALAVGAYQGRVGLSATRVVGSTTWTALLAGRR
ncbi:hypothetical protein GCM10027596_00020 [Nocardioides korecus]